MAKTILVADDTASLRKMVQSYLSQEGFRVLTAADGREALMVARQEQPDLIILDLMMPEMGGYEFLRAYAKDGSAPIIVLTARLEENDKVLGLELGADDYMTKPFSPRELTARVRAVLRRASKDLLQREYAVYDAPQRAVALLEQLATTQAPVTRSNASTRRSPTAAPALG